MIAEQVDALRLAETANAFGLGVGVFLRNQGSVLYSTLCDRARHDAEIVALAARARPGAPPHFSLLCAVHYLLHRQRDAPLARWYATLCDSPLPPEQAWTPFRDFCLARAPEIVALMRERTVQSTAAERAAYVLPLLAHVAGIAGEPLGLIEIGASAGVLLAFDDYRYEFGDFSIGPQDSPVRIRSRWAGPAAAAPRRMPAIGARIGLDLHPVDLSDPDARAWILGSIFPEWRQQHANLQAAFDLVARRGIRTLAGDALDNLDEALAQVPDPLCILHSHCLYYWPAAAKQALDDRLRGIGRRRTVHRIGIEQPDGYAARARDAARAGRPAADESIFPLATCTLYRGGEAQSRTLARCGQYGDFVDWLA
ncbi:MAG: DUF2332 domain-containing protein [Gammaproteobacteria bacterium]